MTTSSVYHVVLFAWQSFWRNFWLSLVAISIIILTLLSINFLIILNVITDTATQIIKDKIDISVDFRPGTTEAQVLEVQSYLSSLPQVKDIHYISQQDALQAFRQLHQGDALIIESLEELDANPLTPSLVIKAKEINQYNNILSVLSQSKYNDLISKKKFHDPNVYISEIRQISDTINRVGLITAGFFIFIALAIVFNTIRVAIYTHREEIAIMKLVGSTNWMIRSPFIVEGVFYGLLACILTAGVVYSVIRFVQPYLNHYFGTTQFDILTSFQHNFWQLFLAELVVIIILNTVSSTIAIRRYLKV